MGGGSFGDTWHVWNSCGVERTLDTFNKDGITLLLVMIRRIRELILEKRTQHLNEIFLK